MASHEVKILPQSTQNFRKGPLWDVLYASVAGGRYLRSPYKLDFGGAPKIAMSQATIGFLDRGRKLLSLLSIGFIALSVG